MTIFVILWWILKNSCFSFKKQISWTYVERAIFFAFKNMDLIFYSGETWKSILCNSNHFKRPWYKGGALHCIESWTFFQKSVFFKKMSKGALWGALCILMRRRYQKWKKRPFFILGLTYHALKAPLRSSISFPPEKNRGFLRWKAQ